MAATATEVRPDLAERLAEAQREEEPLAAAVSQLEAALATAIQDHDFHAALEAQQALPHAREAAAIASATTMGLASAVNRIRDAQAADERAVADAKQRQDTQRELERWNDQHRESHAACMESLATVDALIAATAAEYAAAHAAGVAADEARAQIHQCRMVLGEVGQQIITRTNPAASRLERDALLAAIVRGRVL